MNRIFLALRAKVGWLQPFPNPDIDAANHPTITSQLQPRLNRFLITFQPPESAKRTIPRLANIHGSTILRVEYKNDTISTKPSYFTDSTTPTNTQKQFTSTTPRPLPNHYSTTRKARQNCRAATVPLPLRQRGRKLLILFSSALHHICAKAEHGRNFRRWRRASCVYHPQVL